MSIIVIVSTTVSIITIVIATFTIIFIILIIVFVVLVVILVVVMIKIESPVWISTCTYTRTSTTIPSHDLRESLRKLAQKYMDFRNMGQDYIKPPIEEEEPVLEPGHSWSAATTRALNGLAHVSSSHRWPMKQPAKSFSSRHDSITGRLDLYKYHNTGRHQIGKDPNIAFLDKTKLQDYGNVHKPGAMAHTAPVTRCIVSFHMTCEWTPSEPPSPVDKSQRSRPAADAQDEGSDANVEARQIREQDMADARIRNQTNAQMEHESYDTRIAEEKANKQANCKNGGHPKLKAKTDQGPAKKKGKHVKGQDKKLKATDPSPQARGRVGSEVKANGRVKDKPKGKRHAKANADGDTDSEDKSRAEAKGKGQPRGKPKDRA